jgi:NAD(P)-dependent dehydrogenase (short-subunit alcohol dehydrogenase family)
VTDKRVILITGASRGIGAATARALAAPGRVVLVNYRSSRDAAETVARDAAARGAESRAIQADVTSAGQVDAMFDAVAKDYGRLDALVCNAGVPYRYSRLAQQEIADYEVQWSAQLKASFLCCRRAVALMAARKAGDIVFVLSSAASGEPPAFMLPYVSAKYAVLGFSKGLAAEAASKGVRVRAVFPGMTETDFIKDFPRPVVDAAREKSASKKLAAPEDAAREIAALLAPAPAEAP